MKRSLRAPDLCAHSAVYGARSSRTTALLVSYNSVADPLNIAMLQKHDNCAREPLISLSLGLALLSAAL